MERSGPDGVLVYLAGVDWDAVKGTDRHLVERLGRLVPVLWVDPAVSVVHPARQRRLGEFRRGARVVDVAPGVRRVSVLAPPFPTRRGMVGVSALVVSRILAGVFRHLAVTTRAVVSSSPASSFRAVPSAPGVPLLYYATDDFVAGAALMGLSPEVLRGQEDARVAEATVLAGVTEEIVSRWDAAGRKTLVLPNGCDPEAYDGVDRAPLPSDVDLRPPVAGLVGQISSRIDLELLESVAAGGTSLLLVGPTVRTTDVARFDALVARPNVCWVGQKSFAELPSYLRLVDVGLTPYTQSAFNRASFPLKTLEYLAAGRAVVSSPLPAVDALRTSLIVTARGPEAFAAAVRREAAVERTPELFARRRSFAATQSWDARAAVLLAALGIRPVGR